MATKKKAPAVDPELAAAQSLKLSSIDDAKAAVQQIGLKRIEGTKLKATGDGKTSAIKAKYSVPAARLLQIASVLEAKVLEFALNRRKKLPLVGQRWIVDDYGHVQFRSGNTKVVLNEGIDTAAVIANLRAAEVDLVTNGIDIEDIIQTTESVKLDDLRTIPAELREQIGFTIIESTSATLVLDDEKLQRAFSKHTRRKPS